jgi:glycosyltransferase involved in cell wall biosynthesis
MSDRDFRVSVIVPTYGRAGLLERTLPTYLQPEVGELIVVDDASPDETEAVVARLAMSDARIRYLRSDENLKQTHAKNMGIDAASFPFVYFGDDDSVLSPGSIGFLLETLDASGASIVGARAPYLSDEGEAEEACGPRDKLAVNWRTIHARFDLALRSPAEAPFVHAAFLATTELARSLYFDEGFTGNCYREETDFILRAREAGASIWFDSRAVQTNLPRSAAGGGAHGRGGSFLSRKLRYFASSLSNNRRFLRRHHAWLAAHYPVPHTIFGAQTAFAFSIALSVMRNAQGRIRRCLARSL